MLAPRYFENFYCTADKCTHSCCIGWEIDIDESTLAYYKSLPAHIGERILKTVQFNADGACFQLTPDKRCKNLDKHGLCRIYQALGHEGLCDICREHPRFYHETDRAEAGLGAACMAAAALILSSDAYDEFICLDGDHTPIPLATDFHVGQERAALYKILSNRSRPLTERLADLTACYGNAAPLPLDKLEYLEEAHRSLFLRAASADTPIPAELESTCERFLAYLVYRHASPTRYLIDFARAVRLSLALLSLFAALVTAEGLTPIAAAVALSEEIEYSEDNTALLLAAV